MKALFVGLFSASTLLGATSPDRVILAAMRISEVKNYTWTASVMDDARSYTIDGKTQKGGYTWVRLPMVPAIAQRLGRDADTEVEAVFKGSQRAVIRTIRGWRTPGELPKPALEWSDHYVVWPVSRARQSLWELEDSGFGDPWDVPTVILPPPSAFPAEEQRPYSNAQFAVAHPHDELAIIVSSFATLRVSGDVATGALTDLGAQLLLVREGQDHLSPIAAAGTFKLHLKNGVVARYQLRLEGLLLVERKKVHVRQASTTVITDIGRTQFAVPDEVRSKLEF